MRPLRNRERGGGVSQVVEAWRTHLLPGALAVVVELGNREPRANARRVEHPPHEVSAEGSAFGRGEHVALGVGVQLDVLRPVHRRGTREV